ncbi:hypothetical protein D1872_220390 [compost metagenome]
MKRQTVCFPVIFEMVQVPAGFRLDDRQRGGGRVVPFYKGLGRLPCQVKLVPGNRRLFRLRSILPSPSLLRFSPVHA